MTAEARRGGAARRLSIAFVLPYGEPSEGFFPDALLEHLCALASDRGHDARIVRVYYDGRDARRDADVRAKLGLWLEERHADLVVVERLFDPVPIEAHVRREKHRRSVLMSWGDGDVMDGVDLVVGRTPGLIRGGATRRSPSAGELANAFVDLVDALSRDEDPSRVAGVARIVAGVIRGGAAARSAPLTRPFWAVLDHAVIAPGTAPRLTRKYLFGNAGCPFALDPSDNAHYAGAEIPADSQISRLGCAFCHAGGDYQKRNDGEVIDELLDQATFYLDHAPDISELVLVDQHALRTLAPLLRAATAKGLRPTRWLFSARADAWVRDRARVDEAVVAAREGGHGIELYLSGFEALCDRELARYNKGVTVSELIAAVDAMRARRRSDPETFEYARARGHSLILWNPWTQPADLAETVHNVRENGLVELFTDLGKNRLRLYPDLPIHYAAARDGALADAWDDADEGAARRKGYSVEQPWRFLDARTRLAHALSRALRDHLGPETELPQLSSIVSAVQSSWDSVIGAEVPAVCDRVIADLSALERALPPRPRGERAHVVQFAGACNNGCRTCANRDEWLDDDSHALMARVDAARSRPRAAIMLAGREPTIHATFLQLVARARGEDARAVGVVTNGRRFAYPAFARASIAAGLSAASIKLFAADEASADAIARVPGAHGQALSAIAELGRTGNVALEIRVPLHANNLSSLADFADVAAEAHVAFLRVEVGLDGLRLDRLAEAAEAMERLRARAAASSVAIGATPISSGARGFDSLPESPSSS